MHYHRLLPVNLIQERFAADFYQSKTSATRCDVRGNRKVSFLTLHAVPFHVSVQFLCSFLCISLAGFSEVSFARLSDGFNAWPLTPSSFASLSNAWPLNVSFAGFPYVLYMTFEGPLARFCAGSSEGSFARFLAVFATTLKLAVLLS